MSDEIEPYDSSTPLDKLIEYVNEKIHGEGGTCPVCDKPVQKRREVLYSSIVSVLAVVFELGGTERAVGLPEVRREQVRFAGVRALTENDFTKGANRLRFFGLAVPVDGGWLCLPEGAEFLHGRHQVQKIAWTYNGEILYREGPMVSVDDVMKIKFDLRKFLDGEL